MNKKWYDFSHDYVKGMPEAAGHRTFTIRNVKNPNTGSSISNLLMNSHCGTHLDAPRHYIESGKSIDQFPPDFFSGQAAVVEIIKDSFEPITVDDLRTGEKIISQADFLFIRTGWEDKWGDPDYVWKYPYILPEVADYILTTKIRILGTDTMSPDPSMKSGLRKGSPIHLTLLPRDVLIVENLANMKTAAGKLIQVYCFPLKFVQVDGSPARIVGRET